MSAGAIVMLVVAVAILWGGLAMAIVRLRKHPDELSPTADDAGAPPESPGGGPRAER